MEIQILDVVSSNLVKLNSKVFPDIVTGFELLLLSSLKSITSGITLPRLLMVLSEIVRSERSLSELS